MSKRNFTEEQINDVMKNGNVNRCSPKSITYSPGFKVKAIELYLNEGLSPRSIFKRAGFDEDIIGKDTPTNCLKCWRRIVKKKGVAGLRVESRGSGGGRPKTRGLTDTQKIKYLEAKVAYLKAENDFLAKLRAKRAESNSGQNKNSR